MSDSSLPAKVVVLTGGAWWGGSSPSNVGHHFVKQAVQNAAEHDQPLRLYMCTRKAPPAGELERFIPRHGSSSSLQRPESSTGQPTSQHISLRHLPLDLLDPASVRRCAAGFLSQESYLDVLVLNAAIAPNRREPTGLVVPSLETDKNTHSDEGDFELEQGMMTNVVGTAMLARLLEPALLKSAQDAGEHGTPRVVLVSSELHRRLGDLEVNTRTIHKLLSPDNWKGMQAYKLTKLIQTIWLYAMQREYGNRIDCVAVSPGFIPSTSLSRASSAPARLFMSYLLHYMPFASTAEEGGRKVYRASLEPLERSQGRAASNAVYLKNDTPTEADYRVYDEDLGNEWKQWIQHAVETVTTPIASVVSPTPNVLVVGGTAGIGAALAQKLAHQLPLTSQITIAGRNSDAAAEVIASIRQQHQGHLSHDAQQFAADFDKVDCARMSDVERFCEQYGKRLRDTGRRLDILILTHGIVSMSGRTPASPNSKLDLKLALHYYSRMLIIRELTASFADQPIILSVLDGRGSNAHDQSIFWDDLALSQPGHYGLRSARKHGLAMTDVMMQDFASSPSKPGQTASFIHAYPGFVSTGTFRNPSVPFWARFALAGLSKVFASSPDTCADRLIKGTVKCHRATLANADSISQAGYGGRWYNIDREKIVQKLPVDSKVLELVRTHTWQAVDGPADA